MNCPQILTRAQEWYEVLIFWFFFGIRNVQPDFFFDFRISSFLYNFNSEIFEIFRKKNWKNQKLIFSFWLGTDFLGILDSGVVRFHLYHLYFVIFRFTNARHRYSINLISLNSELELASEKCSVGLLCILEGRKLSPDAL